MVLHSIALETEGDPVQWGRLIPRNENPIEKITYYWKTPLKKKIRIIKGRLSIKCVLVK